MRKVHTGENKWEDFEEEEDEIIQPPVPGSQIPNSQQPPNFNNINHLQNNNNYQPGSLQNFLNKYKNQAQNVSPFLNKPQSPRPSENQPSTSANWMNPNFKFGSQLTTPNKDFSSTVTPSKLNVPAQSKVTKDSLDNTSFYEYEEEAPDDYVPLEYLDNVDDLDAGIDPEDLAFPDDEMEEEIQQDTKKVKKT
jgi:hypothetical protein